MDSEENCVQIHDLYREFGKLEAQGKVNESADFEKRRWVYCEGADDVTELDKEPSYRCWPNLIRIDMFDLKVENLRGIEWGYFSNVEVLRLYRLRNLQGVLNLKGLKRLRSLEILGSNKLDTVDGLQGLTKLVYFSWISMHVADDEDAVPRRIIGQLPASLQVLTVYVYYRGVSFAPDLFTRCAKLTTLEVKYSRVKNLDFSACAALQSVVIDCADVENVDFRGCSSLRTVCLTELCKLQCVARLRGEAISNLQTLIIQSCPRLVGIPGLGQMVVLQNLDLEGIYEIRKLPDLQTLTRLQVLRISSMHIEEVPGLSLLRQLRELRWTSSRSTSMKLPSLSGFEELETVDLCDNPGLSSLEGMFGDLPALRFLNLIYCRSLCRLPDLSRAKQMEELCLNGSGVELREDEMCMLAALRVLHPVEGHCYTHNHEVRLDIVRGKVEDVHYRNFWWRDL